MDNIISAKVTIKGTRPQFFHRFGPDSISLEKQEKTGKAGNDPEEWRKTFVATKEGQCYFDPTYIFATIRGGSKFVPKGRGSIQSVVSATLQVADNRVLIDRWFPGYPNGQEFDPKKAAVPDTDPDLPVYLDVRGVVNPATKGRNVRYRIVASPGWSCSFTIAWDKTVVSRGEMESAIVNAGKLVGIGNARAIGMGRFEVETFELME